MVHFLRTPQLPGKNNQALQKILLETSSKNLELLVILM